MINQLIYNKGGETLPYVCKCRQESAGTYVEWGFFQLPIGLGHIGVYSTLLTAIKLQDPSAPGEYLEQLLPASPEQAQQHSNVTKVLPYRRI